MSKKNAVYLFAACKYRVELATEDSDLLRFPESINIEQFIGELKK